MNILFDFKKSSLYFDNPVSVIDCSSFKDVAQAFEKIQEALLRGLYVAGFFSYELGYAFEEKFSSYQQNGFPLIRVGCYKKSQQYNDQLENIVYQMILLHFEIFQFFSHLQYLSHF